MPDRGQPTLTAIFAAALVALASPQSSDACTSERLDGKKPDRAIAQAWLDAGDASIRAAANEPEAYDLGLDAVRAYERALTIE